MTSKTNPWTKAEMQAYILLLCAKADSEATEEEISMIKSKTDSAIFNKIFEEFSKDNEEEGLEKIGTNIHLLEYSHLEIEQFRKEMHEVFFADKSFNRMEQNLDKILDNIIY